MGVLRERRQPRSYRLGKRFAAGGMGELYEIQASDLSTSLCAKRMIATEESQDEMKSLFLREVFVAASLDHPHVVQVIDVGEFEGQNFMIMERVEGPSLAEVLAEHRHVDQPIDMTTVLSIFLSVARGLVHAHERTLPDGTPLGIVHRDVAVENILLPIQGIPRLVDFGLAKVSLETMTAPGTVRGRPRSLAPEQAKGVDVDIRADVFGLGAVLFETLSLDTLYPNLPLAALLFRVVEGRYDSIEKRLRAVHPNCDSSLIEVIERALHVDPKQRFRSVREMMRAVDSMAAGLGLRLNAECIRSLASAHWDNIKEQRHRLLEGSRGEYEEREITFAADKLEPVQGVSPGTVSLDLEWLTPNLPPKEVSIEQKVPEKNIRAWKLQDPERAKRMSQMGQEQFRSAPILEGDSVVREFRASTKLLRMRALWWILGFLGLATYIFLRN